MTREIKPTRPAMAVGFALFCACLALALWQGEWRWLPTGFILLMLGAVVANTRKAN